MAPGHDLIDTINRLLAKHPAVIEAGRPFAIPRDVTIREEQWELSRLWTVIHPQHVTSDEPAALTGALVVLRWKGAEYLIDGRRRINHWYRGKHDGPHRVLVVTEEDTKSPN